MAFRYVARQDWVLQEHSTHFQTNMPASKPRFTFQSIVQSIVQSRVQLLHRPVYEWLLLQARLCG